MGLRSWLGRRERDAATTPLGFAVIDLETTGLVLGRDRVVEVAIVRTDPTGQVTDEWVTLLNPGRWMGATSVHGITAGDVRAAPRFTDVVGEVNSRLSGRVLVAHNAPFDLAFMRGEYERAGWTLPAAPHLCTMEAASRLLPDLARGRLQDYCGALQIPLHDAHTALGDARATAGLLAHCLTAAWRDPRSPYLALTAQGAQLQWPVIPTQASTPALRQHRGAGTPAPVPPGTLWALLDDLPLSSSIEHGAPAEATQYLELLFEVLEDGVLTLDEAQALAEVAGVYALTREQVQATHRGFLLSLAHRIVEDGSVTKAERSLLTDAATALGVDPDLPGRVLDEARAALRESRSATCRPLPDGWQHGEPLRVGQSVAFTGCDPLVRARLEGRAQAAGLRVASSVSGKTAALVTDGSEPGTVKARKADQFGTRVVTPDLFAVLLDHVQPASP